MFGTFLNRHEAFKVLQNLWKRKKLYAESLEVAQLTSNKSLEEITENARLAMEKNCGTL